MKNTTKEIMLTFRATVDEANALTKAADKSKVSRSAIIRACCLYVLENAVKPKKK